MVPGPPPSGHWKDVRLGSHKVRGSSWCRVPASRSGPRAQGLRRPEPLPVTARLLGYVLRRSAMRLGRGVRLSDRRVPAGDSPSGDRPRDRPVQRAPRAATVRPDRSPQVCGWNRHPRLPAQRGEPMRMLHFGLRVADPGRSLAFHAAVGYQVIGSVPRPPGPPDHAQAALRHTALSKGCSAATSIAACLPMRSGLLLVCGRLTGAGGPGRRGAIDDGRRLPAPPRRPRPP
jgi:hypothetical protein